MSSIAVTGHALRHEVKDPKAKEARLARIEELENEVYEHAAGIVQAVLAFHEVSPQQPEPPQEWIDQWGYDAAMKRLAVAKAGWMPKAVFPAGAEVAMRTMQGIARGRKHNARLAVNNLNVRIALPAPTTQEHPGPVKYEVRDLEE